MNPSRTQPQALQDLDDSNDVLNQTELIDDIKNKCIINVPTWESVSPNQLHVAVVSGGCSNYIFRVCLTDHPRHEQNRATEVLVRIFGSGLMDLGIDRETESLCQGLASAQGISPRCIASFQGGRIEEFVSNARTWSMHDLREPSRADLLAAMMGKLHSIEHPSLLKKAPMLPDRLRDWAIAAKEASDKIVLRGDRNARLALALDAYGLLTQEVPWLISTLTEMNPRTVLSHSDFNAGNILEVEKEGGATAGEIGKLFLVDFEYSGCDWRAYDIANLFNEMGTDNQCPVFPHFAIDPGAFPCLDLQNRFLLQYLRTVSGGSVMEEEVENLRKEVDFFRLASHLQWALWSIVQEDRSTICFGFLDYAIQRTSLYFSLKADLIG